MTAEQGIPDRLVVSAEERLPALLDVIRQARTRITLSLFRCNDAIQLIDWQFLPGDPISQTAPSPASMPRPGRRSARRCGSPRRQTTPQLT